MQTRPSVLGPPTQTGALDGAYALLPAAIHTVRTYVWQGVDADQERLILSGYRLAGPGWYHGIASVGSLTWSICKECNRKRLCRRFFAHADIGRLILAQLKSPAWAAPTCLYEVRRPGTATQPGRCYQMIHSCERTRPSEAVSSGDARPSRQSHSLSRMWQVCRIR